MSDRTGNLASSLADGHVDDPAVTAAIKLEKMMHHMHRLALQMVQVIDSVEPQRPISRELLVECMHLGCKVMRLQGLLIKGFCRKHYDKARNNAII